MNVGDVKPAWVVPVVGLAMLALRQPLSGAKTFGNWEISQPIDAVAAVLTCPCRPGRTDCSCACFLEAQKYLLCPAVLPALHLIAHSATAGGIIDVQALDAWISLLCLVIVLFLMCTLGPLSRFRHLCCVLQLVVPADIQIQV